MTQQAQLNEAAAANDLSYGRSPPQPRARKMSTDARGEPVSGTTARAMELYETALRQFQSYVGDPVETIEQALEDDPDFVLGHVFRASMLLMATEQRYVSDAISSVSTAERLAGKANNRERGLIRATRRWLEGDWEGACRGWDDVLVEHPRDALAIQAAHLTDFLRGDALNLRDRIARILPHWNEDTPGYSYILGMHAFGLEECNLYPQAEEAGRRALDIEPNDGWAVHAVAHVMEMQARFDDGIEWYTSREQDWAPDNGFAFHNWWHLGLYHQERGDYPRALTLYDEQIYPQPVDEPADMSMQMLDASAFLWRLYLQRVDTGKRWTPLAAAWEEKTADENGYYAFNDVHAMMAFVCDGREAVAAALLEDLQKTATGNGSTGHINVMMTRDVGLPVCRALLAFSQGRYDNAIDLLLPARPIAQRFGGSHAQRDLLNQTLIEAAIRAERHGLAANLINERVALKPDSPLAWRFQARARQTAGDTSAALAAISKAETLTNSGARSAG